MNESLEEARARVAGRARAATRKVSRLKRATGVEISGSAVDPRRDPKLVAKYNRRQLAAYERDLNSFVSRRTQYVPDAQGRPIKSKTWNEYKRSEAAYNAGVTERFGKVKDIPLPISGQTIGERMDAMTPEHRQAYNPAINAPYKPPTRKSKQIASEKALKKLTRQMKDRLDPRAEGRAARAARDQLKQMLDVINEPDLQAAVDKLTNGQFMTMWNYTQFATNISLNYDVKQRMMSGKEKPWYSEALKQAVRNSHALADWAGSLASDGGLRDDDGPA